MFVAVRSPVKVTTDRLKCENGSALVIKTGGVSNKFSLNTPPVWGLFQLI